MNGPKRRRRRPLTIRAMLRSWRKTETRLLALPDPQPMDGAEAEALAAGCDGLIDEAMQLPALEVSEQDMRDMSEMQERLLQDGTL